MSWIGMKLLVTHGIKDFLEIMERILRWVNN